MKLLSRALKCLLCFLILVSLSPKIAWAKDAVLIFWLDDTDSDSIFKGAMSERNFDLRRSQLKNQFSDVDLYPVITKNATEGLQKVGEILAENTVISHLIVATHGSYRAKDNQTSLVGLGGFSPDGPSGLFKDLLDFLHQRHNLGKSLHIYLESCSNFRGTVADLRVRADAVASYTQKFGVQKMSMWGANQLFWSADFYSANFLQKVLDGHSKGWALFATSGGIWLAVVGASHFLMTNPNLVHQLVQKVSYDMVRFDLAASAMITSLPWVIKLFSGTNGKLYISDETGVSIQEIDGLSPGAIRLPCADYL